MTRLGLILLAALATSTRAAWRLDSKMTRPTKLLLATLAAAAATPWPRLDEALANYPSIHARETAKIKNGDKTAKFVLVVCYHGLGNRHHALVSAFALALARRRRKY